MKTRLGFVSNSSSTAFILDKRLPSVARWVEENGGFIPKPHGCGRMTCLAVGQDARDYAVFLNADLAVWEMESDLGNWILEWASEIGTENLVFARESDEGMGGSLGESFPYHKSLAEMEYH